MREIKNEINKLLWELSVLPFEEEAEKFYKKHGPYGVSVDVGAGIGRHTKELAKISDKVIAIEPVNELGNVPENVDVHKVAVGEKKGTKEIKIFDESEMGRPTIRNATFFEDERETETKKVNVLPLDEIVTNADFLIIDIEGYEIKVLKTSHILKSVDVAVIETHENRRPGEKEELKQLLGDFLIYNDGKRLLCKRNKNV